ncbi:hypothetical protein U9M48_025505 [Paspalum notatum var. saurae]|uniref:Uncharacterized protein n=1 Tax=Paspalum notatum var. saurae TaxID=547442 RepID=A0AAQ3TSM9_PASNO
MMMMRRLALARSAASALLIGGSARGVPPRALATDAPAVFDGGMAAPAPPPAEAPPCRVPFPDARKLLALMHKPSLFGPIPLSLEEETAEPRRCRQVPG